MKKKYIVDDKEIEVEFTKPLDPDNKLSASQYSEAIDFIQARRNKKWIVFYWIKRVVLFLIFLAAIYFFFFYR